jgi:deoxyhypusine synthase
LKEACSWGKVDTAHEQMVYAEATLALPLIISYAYHEKKWQDRVPREYNDMFGKEIK